MAKGEYLIRVLVNGSLIPYYQYVSVNIAKISVGNSNTPQIKSIWPTSGLPGTFVTINGDFKVDFVYIFYI